MQAALRSNSFWVTAAILAAGWGATLALSWPGHLSYDSIVQLHDGREGFYHTWHPPVMAWLLGVGDAVLPGAGLFMLFDATLLFAAWLALLWIWPRASWLAAISAALCVPLPQLLLYQAIVWKDVLFADSAVAGFVCLALAEAKWSRARLRFAFLTLACLLFALAALTRQNGAIVPLIGAAALGVVAARAGGRRQGAFHGLGALVLSGLVALSAGFALSRHSDHGEGPVEQLKLLRLYDLIGAVKADPSLPLTQLKHAAPALEARIRGDGARLYSVERNDTLADSQALQDALDDAAPALMAAQWSDLVLHHPWLYLKERARVFGWVFFTPDIAACRPVFTGLDGPAGEMEDLGLVPRHGGRDIALGRYAEGFMGTPAFSHLLYAVLALITAVLLLRRRKPGDTAIAFLQFAALAFTASFFMISIACDYRYLYFLDLAALTGLFALACDAAYLFQVLAMWSLSPWLERSADRKS